jgi:hypothetical protein
MLSSSDLFWLRAHISLRASVLSRRGPGLREQNRECNEESYTTQRQKPSVAQVRTSNSSKIHDNPLTGRVPHPNEER